MVLQIMEQEIATNSALVVSQTTITVINSVNQFERDSVYYNKYTVDYYTDYNFLTRCPNFSNS